MLSPLSGAGGPPLIQQNASEAEIFYNATGFLRCMGRQAGGRAMGMSQRRQEKPASVTEQLWRLGGAHGKIQQARAPRGVGGHREG